MPAYSGTSIGRLNTCDERLKKLFNKVIKHWDCSIICGYRNAEEQKEAFDTGKSMIKFPDSKHNSYPSTAIDVAPYYNGIGIDWNDIIGFAYFAGYVKRIADEMDIKVRWGGDWDGDKRNKDQSFNDLPHWELVE